MWALDNLLHEFIELLLPLKDKVSGKVPSCLFRWQGWDIAAGPLAPQAVVGEEEVLESSVDIEGALLISSLRG